MKVLTVWHPWASLIAIGAKPYEFRKGLPPRSYVGTRIAIHAAKRPIVEDEVLQLLHVLDGRHAWRTCLRPNLAVPLLERFLREPEIVPYSSILCTAVLGQPKKGPEVVAEFGGPSAEVITGIINDSDRDDQANWAWPLTEIEAVVPPAEHRGQQGWSLWTPQ